MKAIKFLCVLIFVFLTNEKKAQIYHTKIQQPQLNENRDCIKWSENRKLEWSDFKGAPDQRSIKLDSVVAMSYLGFINELEENSDSILIVINAIFFCDSSWGIQRDWNTLRHEQKHFDITEMIARKYRMEMCDYLNAKIKEGINYDTLKKVFLIQLFDKYTELNLSIQRLYDSETINHERQVFWNMKIALMLDDLKAYSSPRIAIAKPKQKGFPRTMIFR